LTDANGTQREPLHDPSNDSVGVVEFASRYVNKLLAFAGLIPTAVTWKGMPMYESQRATLLSLTSLFCILIIGFLFMNRELIPRAKSRIGKFGSAFIALCLMGACAYCVVRYLGLLNYSTGLWNGSEGDALKNSSPTEISNGGSLIVHYVLAMVAAEAALFFMAIREWNRSKD
jgi:hypothetical protein